MQPDRCRALLWGHPLDVRAESRAIVNPCFEHSTTHPLASQFVATFFLSGLVAFFGTVLRFRFTKNNMLWMLMLVGMALTIAAEYHSRAALWKFGVHFMYFAVMAAASLLLTMSTVLPQYAGAL